MVSTRFARSSHFFTWPLFAEILESIATRYKRNGRDRSSCIARGIVTQKTSEISFARTRKAWTTAPRNLARQSDGRGKERRDALWAWIVSKIIFAGNIRCESSHEERRRGDEPTVLRVNDPLTQDTLFHRHANPVFFGKISRISLPDNYTFKFKFYLNTLYVPRRTREADIFQSYDGRISIRLSVWRDFAILLRLG